jgi:hypothetical protein
MIVFLRLMDQSQQIKLLMRFLFFIKYVNEY